MIEELIKFGYQINIDTFQKNSNRISRLLKHLPGTYFIRQIRPSEIRYTKSSVSPYFEDYFGEKVSFDQVLRKALERKLNSQAIAWKLTVVNRPKNQRYFLKKNKQKDPRNYPGYWALDGLDYLWILKAMEEFGVLSGSLKFRCLDSIPDADWWRLCSSQLLEGGNKLEGSGFEDLDEIKQNVFKERRNALAPCWRSVIINPDTVVCQSLLAFKIFNQINTQDTNDDDEFESLMNDVSHQPHSPQQQQNTQRLIFKSAFYWVFLSKCLFIICYFYFVM